MARRPWDDEGCILLKIYIRPMLGLLLRMSVVAVIENHALGTVTLRRRVMDEIKAAGHELHILTGASVEFDQAIAAGFSMHDIGTSAQNPLHVGRYLATLTRSLRALGPDVCLTYTMRPAIYGNLACMPLRIPTITNITGIGPLFESNALAYRVARVLYRVAMRHPSLLFFQNQDDREIFLDKGLALAKRSRCIPGSGIDYERYSPRPADDNRENLVFLFIGRLVKDKGITEFIAAAKSLRISHPSVRCQVLGPLWTQNIRSNTIVRKDVDAWNRMGTVEYLGETSDVRDFIAAADCVVLPSYREGSANVLLEASSMAKPVIATEVTGCKEIIEHECTGLLCRARDVESLAAAMRSMADRSSEARAAMGRAGRKKVVREYDKQIVIDAYLQAIAEVTS